MQVQPDYRSEICLDDLYAEFSKICLQEVGGQGPLARVSLTQSHREGVPSWVFDLS
jgi:hypothetical protein